MRISSPCCRAKARSLGLMLENRKQHHRPAMHREEAVLLSRTRILATRKKLGPLHVSSAKLKGESQALGPTNLKFKATNGSSRDTQTNKYYKSSFCSLGLFCPSVSGVLSSSDYSRSLSCECETFICPHGTEHTAFHPVEQ